MNSAYKHIIFDLDGTISDSREGIFNAYLHTTDQLNLGIPEKEQLLSLIGPPLQKGFRDVFGLQGEDNEIAVKVFRAYYGSKGLFENILYDGIKGLLERLQEAGCLLYVATAKYEVYAHQVLKHFGIHELFTDVAGADYNGLHASKVQLIATLLRRNNLTDPSTVVVIGDTRYDIEAASELAIDSVAVTYGFTAADEIIAFDPDYVANSVEDLEKVLLQE